MSGLLLAGGGHSHALLLRRWAMRPHNRPEGLITLVSRSSTALYSGMVPGPIAGLYQREQVEVNLRALADQAGVALTIAEIISLDTETRRLHLLGRPELTYDYLSLNLGAVTRSLPCGFFSTRAQHFATLGATVDRIFSLSISLE